MTPKNILVYRLGSLGDFVVALPCLHLIRRIYPEARIVLLTNHPVSGKAAPAMQILEGSGLCDDSVAYPVGLRNWTEISNLRRNLVNQSFDAAILLNASRGRGRALRDWMFFRTCGISEIIGLALANKDMPFSEARQLPVERECSRLARRLRTVGAIDLSDRENWNIRLTHREEEQGKQLLHQHGLSRTFIAASVGTKLLANDWGNENWINLFDRLSEECSGMSLVMVGASDEHERSNYIRHAWHGNSVNLCGQCAPRITAAILNQASLFLGHDSGPMHLAASAGIPTIGIFSWNNPPGQWFPCHQSWRQIESIYPPLPASGWRQTMRLQRSSAAGILLIRPELVVKTALALLSKHSRNLS